MKCRGIDWLPILVIIVVPFILIAGALGLANLTQEIIGIELNNEQKICISNCTERGFEFTKFNSKGITPDECWCADNGEPKRIW